MLAPPPSSEQPLGASQLLTGNPARVTARLRAGGWAVLSQGLAAEYGLHVGQAFTLPSPRPVSFRVAALSTNLGWPPGSIMINSQEYARAWASADPSAYVIRTQPGAAVAQVARRIRRALAPNAGLTVETYIEREQRHYALARQGLSRLTQIRLLVLIAAMLAIGGAMGALIWQRRDLVAFIKCEGYRQGVLWRWLLCESAILLVAGCSIGAVFGLYGELLLSHALARVTGFPVVFHVGALIALTSFALVSVVAVVDRCSRRLSGGARASEDSQPSVLTRPDGHLPQVPRPGAALGSTAAGARERRGARARCGACRPSRARCACGACKAMAIPDAPIREDALSALARKRAHTDGAALFWIIPRARNLTLLRMLVAFEIMCDFLDSANEHGARMGQANGRQLHLALIDALAPERPLADYYRYHPWRADGGYLCALVEVCRECCRLLPGYEGVRRLVVQEALRAQVLAINHDLDPRRRDLDLRAWAAGELAIGREVTWFELTGAASAPLNDSRAARARRRTVQLRGGRSRRPWRLPSMDLGCDDDARQLRRSDRRRRQRRPQLRCALLLARGRRPAHLPAGAAQPLPGGHAPPSRASHPDRGVHGGDVPLEGQRAQLLAVRGHRVAWSRPGVLSLECSCRS